MNLFSVPVENNVSEAVLNVILILLEFEVLMRKLFEEWYYPQYFCDKKEMKTRKI